MNNDIKTAMEEMERRAEEIKASSKMHNVLCEMASDILTLAKCLRRAFEDIDRLENQPTYGSKRDAS